MAEYTTKVNEMTVLKFGRLVDLEQLEGLTANHIVEELRTKLRALEKKAATDIASREVTPNCHSPSSIHVFTR